MSAKVKPGTFGGWVGVCSEHNESIAGTMAGVDLWADVHNEEHHKKAA